MRGHVGLEAWLVVVGMLSALPAVAKPEAPRGQSSTQDIALLQEAFSHDLCTRNDRELRKLTKALGRKPSTR